MATNMWPALIDPNLIDLHSNYIVTSVTFAFRLVKASVSETEQMYQKRGETRVSEKKMPRMEQ
jgi:hypothetical protein